MYWSLLKLTIYCTVPVCRTVQLHIHQILEVERFPKSIAKCKLHAIKHLHKVKKFWKHGRGDSISNKILTINFQYCKELINILKYPLWAHPPNSSILHSSSFIFTKLKRSSHKFRFITKNYKSSVLTVVSINYSYSLLRKKIPKHVQLDLWRDLVEAG